MKSFAEKTIILSTIFFPLLKPILPESNITKNISETLTQGSGHWVQDVGSSTWTWHFQFKPNGKLIYYFAGEGSWQIDGHYSIKGDTIQVAVTGKNESDIDITRNHTCSMRPESESIKYSMRLDCGKITYFSHGIQLLNARRKYKGTEVITLRIEKPKILTAVKFRTDPSVSAKVISCKVKSDGFTYETMKKSDSLRPGTWFTIIARTAEKVQVEKWKNYWYLIDIHYDPHDGESCDKGRGWIFGEFVSF